MEDDENEYREYKRYFIIYFTGLDIDKKLQRGKIHMFTEEGQFVNEEFIQTVIKEDFNLEHPYIEQIMELEEEDFNDFIKTKEEKEVPSKNKGQINLPPHNEDLNDFI